jgi:hypothetical protein
MNPMQCQASPTQLEAIMPELDVLRVTLSLLVAHLRQWRNEDGSATLEQLLITISLVGGALAAGAFIVSRVNAAAQSIPTGP